MTTSTRKSIARRYRKVEIPMWTDAKFQSLSAAPPNGQTLWQWLLTGQRTTIFPGLVVATLPLIASDLKWPVDADLWSAGAASEGRVANASRTRRERVCRSAREAWNEVADQGMAKADFESGVIVLTKALFEAPGVPRDSAKPSSANHLRGWAKEWPMIPECPLKDEYLLTLQAFAHACSKKLGRAFDNAFETHLERVADASRTRQERNSNASPISYAPGTGTGTGSRSEEREREARGARDGSLFDPPMSGPEEADGGPTIPADDEAEPDRPPPPDADAVPDAPEPEVISSAQRDVGGVGGDLVPFPGASRFAPAAPQSDLPPQVLARPDPALRARMELGNRGWDRLNAVRATIAAELGLPKPQHLHFMGRGRAELARRLEESGPYAEEHLEHVFAVAIAQARFRDKSLKYLSGMLFEPGSWEAKLGMDPNDFAPIARGKPTHAARKAAGAAPPRGSVFDAVEEAASAFEASMAAASANGDEP